MGVGEQLRGATLCCIILNIIFSGTNKWLPAFDVSCFYPHRTTTGICQFNNFPNSREGEGLCPNTSVPLF